MRPIESHRQHNNTNGPDAGDHLTLESRVIECDTTGGLDSTVPIPDLGGASLISG